MKQIAILGSTGSIGTQTLDVVRQHPDAFSIYALTAHRNIDLLIQQALEFNPAVVCIADERLYQPLRDALSDLPIRVMAGERAIAEMVNIYISEVSPAKIRGTLVSLYQLAVTVGFLMAYLMNWVIDANIDPSITGDVTLWQKIMNTEAWRGMLGSETVPALLWNCWIFVWKEYRHLSLCR